MLYQQFHHPFREFHKLPLLNPEWEQHSFLLKFCYLISSSKFLPAPEKKIYFLKIKHSNFKWAVKVNWNSGKCHLIKLPQHLSKRSGCMADFVCKAPHKIFHRKVLVLYHFQESCNYGTKINRFPPSMISPSIRKPILENSNEFFFRVKFRQILSNRFQSIKTFTEFLKN